MMNLIVKNFLGLALLVVAVIGPNTAQAYWFSEANSEKDLSEVESSPGVAIIYPHSIGPEMPGTSNEIEDVTSNATTTILPSAENSTALANEEILETTTASFLISNETTTNQNVTTDSVSESKKIDSDSSSTIAPSDSSTVNVPAVADPAPQYIRRNDEPPLANRIWHFNNQGIRADSVWTRADRSDQDAIESNANPVYTSRSQVTPQSVFVRKPAFEPEVAESNSFNSKVGLGEYPNFRETERNLYFPDINRIQPSNNNFGSSSSALSSAAASSSASSSSSASNSVFTNAAAYRNAQPIGNNNLDYGTKNGAYRDWQQSTTFSSPAKAIRKVVKSKSFGDSFVPSQQLVTGNVQQPVKVRVVVQPNTQNQFNTNFQNNFSERQQDSRSSSSSSASSSSASSFFQKARYSNDFSSANSLDDQREYIHINKVQQDSIKSPPPPPRISVKVPPPTAAIKLPPPPPPAAVKLPPPPPPVKRPPPPPVKRPPPPPVEVPRPPPRPAPIKSYPTKSVISSQIRQPVFEQEYEQQHLENPEPEPYSFNFNVGDDSGNGQFRREEGDRNGVVRGSYGYTDAWGLYRIVDYVADANGFRASIRTNEPGLVERNPVTNEVDAPANIKVSAGETPPKVLDLMRLSKPKAPLI